MRQTTWFRQPMMQANRTFTLLDVETHNASSSGSLYLWNGYEASGTARSLLSYCDEHAVRLREKYGAWVCDLGNTVVAGKRVVDHLGRNDGFSYWWMTLLVEKSIWKSPAIKDAIRLLAIEEILAGLEVSSFRLVSADRRLDAVLRELCRNLGLTYEWERSAENRAGSPGFRRAVLHAVPHWIRSLGNLGRYIAARWPLRYGEKSGWAGGDHAVFFCSYFTNVEWNIADRGIFRSHYWGHMHALLMRLGLRPNWLQLYTPGHGNPGPRAATGILRQFNRATEEPGFHALLDAYLAWGVVRRVLASWIRLNVVTWRLRDIRAAFRPAGSQLSMWPLMQRDWHDSLRGSVAIHNILWTELFDRALADMPHQTKGFYLCENQAWERALIHAWRKHGHGQLIAVPHTTRSFWDLRFFLDQRTLGPAQEFSLPLPDLTAVNGKAALRTFIDGNYPADSLVECEALRYGFLHRLQNGRQSGSIDDKVIKVLVLGDYIPATTGKMMQVLGQAAVLISTPARYSVKPHPNFPVRSEDYPSLHLQIVLERLGKNMRDYDVAFSSNTTSAAVDAYLAGLPVVVMLDQSELNFSPLRGHPGVCFISTPAQLAAAVQVMRRQSDEASDAGEFFFLDPALPRWTHLLAQ